MSNATRVVDLLGEAARIIEFLETNPKRDEAIEAMVARIEHSPQADIIGSMLYAAREALDMRPPK